MQHRRLARAARPDEGRETAGGRLQPSSQLGGATGATAAVEQARGALDDEWGGHEGRGGASGPRCDERGVDGHRLGRALPRHPHAHREQPLPLGLQGGAHRAVGDDPTVVGQDDEPLDEVDPRPEHVLHDDHGRRSRAGRQGRDGIAHLLGRLGVEHGRGLVEQDHRRVESERPGQGKPLGLTPGQRRRGGVEREVTQTDGGERGGDDAGDGRGRHPHVLRPEGHVTPDRRRHDPGAGLLEHQPDGARA